MSKKPGIVFPSPDYSLHHSVVVVGIHACSAAEQNCKIGKKNLRPHAFNDHEIHCLGANGASWRIEFREMPR